MSGGVGIVIPCFNEGQRLSDASLLELLEGDPTAALVLVDDGSSDDTLARLEAFRASHPDRVSVLALEHNVGKAEAVRQGLRQAVAAGHTFVGYLDADMATPPSEMLRLCNIARAQDKDLVIGARVAMLGRHIERSFVRHLLGRVFATSASLILGAKLYDTQCGAKVFRSGPALAAALAEPFRSRWAFDVELLGRLLAGGAGAAGIDLERVVEEPLRAWVDAPGSKLRLGHMVRVARELPLIARDLRRRPP